TTCSILSSYLSLTLSRRLCHCSLSSYTATPPAEIYTLSLHDALPIWHLGGHPQRHPGTVPDRQGFHGRHAHRLHLPHLRTRPPRSEEHTSELQSLAYLVCRLLLEKKKNIAAASTAHQHLVNLHI